MVISYKHKFIFFHVAKVAGLSIKKALQPYTQELDKYKTKRPAKFIDNQPNQLYDMWVASTTHITAQNAQKQLPKEIFDPFYKFAFVRNPWEWQVSMYHFILKETKHINHKRVKSMANFDDYITWVIHRSRKTYPKGATKMQKDMIVDCNDKIIIDFVGRYENLTEDFQKICQQIGIDATLPAINKTTHKNYSTYYSAKSKKMVENYFEVDINLFGYTF